jgi:hypothetical protein
MCKNIKEYLKKQSLQDYGTFLVGICAIVAIFGTNNILEKITKVHSISNNIHITANEIKQISVNVQKTLTVIEEALKSNKAKTIVEQITTKPKSRKIIKDILDGIPEKPDYDIQSPQLILPKEAKDLFLSEYTGKANGNKFSSIDATRFITSKLKVFNPMVNRDLTAILHFSHGLSILSKILPSTDKPWIEFTKTSNDKVIIRLDKSQFKRPPICFCNPSTGIKSCSIIKSTRKEIELSIEGQYGPSSKFNDGDLEIYCHKNK